MITATDILRRLEKRDSGIDSVGQVEFRGADSEIEYSRFIELIKSKGFVLLEVEDRRLKRKCLDHYLLFDKVRLYYPKLDAIYRIETTLASFLLVFSRDNKEFFVVLSDKILEE